MRKGSLLISALVVFFLLAIPYGCFQDINVLNEHFSDSTRYREKQIKSYLTLARDLINLKQENMALEILDGGIDSQMFDWYVVRYKGQNIIFKPDEMSDYVVPEEDGKVIIENDKTCGTVGLKTGAFLTIGINKDILEFEKKIWKRYLKATIQDHVVMFGLLFFVFLYFLKDIMRVLRVLRDKRVGHRSELLSGKSVVSKEGRVLADVISGYEQSVVRLAQEKEMFAKQVLPSLRSEMTSGRTPPYEFECTLVRTDINRYSEMFGMGNRNVLMNVIDRFFTEATKIVTRYGGYLHEFVGDELIFYLKDEEHENSVTMALSCVLEIQQAADTFLEEIKKTYQMPFTIKSSLAMGKLRYGPLVNGFSLVGPAFIESVRILSLVDERMKHQVFVPENVKEKAHEIFTFSEKGSHTLKGYARDRVIFSLAGRRALVHVLQDLCEENVLTLGYYRNPKEIYRVLMYLAENPGMDEKMILRTLGVYRDVFIAGAYPEIRDALLVLAQQFEKHPLQETLLPTIVRLFQTLVDKSLYNQGMHTLFSSALSSTNNRAIANTLEAYVHFEELDIYELYNRFRKSGAARVIGNILLIWGKREINSDLCSVFKERLRGKDLQITASTLYAYAEILIYWHKKDLVYIKAQSEFIDLGEELRDIESKKSAMESEPIQRQLRRAQESLEKLNTP